MLVWSRSFLINKCCDDSMIVKMESASERAKRRGARGDSALLHLRPGGMGG